MKLKTLLLGSAASLMAVSTSFAADVVAEPEPVEYVRVCDAYGAGYFFIPGTERCMQLSGEVRFEYRIDDADLGGSDDVDGDWQYRARFQVRTANESDFGTIRTRIRLEASYSDPLRTTTGFGTDNTGNVAVNVGRDVGLQAMVLNVGNAEFGIFDNFWTTNTGYGNLFAMNDGYYGYDQAIYAQYSFEFAGFNATAGVEQTVADIDADIVVRNADGVIVSRTPRTNFAGDELNFYAGASYGASFGDIAGTVYYDNFNDEFDYKVSLTARPIEGLSLKGWYLGGDGIYSASARGDTIFGFTDPVTGLAGTRAIDGDYAYGLSAAYAIGDFTPYVGFSDTDSVAPATVVVGAVYAPSSTDGLVVQVEGNFAVEDREAINDAGQRFDIDSQPQAYRLRLIKSF